MMVSELVRKYNLEGCSSFYNYVRKHGPDYFIGKKGQSIIYSDDVEDLVEKWKATRGEKLTGVLKANLVHRFSLSSHKADKLGDFLDTNCKKYILGKKVYAGRTSNVYSFDIIPVVEKYLKDTRKRKYTRKKGKDSEFQGPLCSKMISNQYGDLTDFPDVPRSLRITPFYG